jgi:hypothetical protein
MLTISLGRHTRAVDRRLLAHGALRARPSLLERHNAGRAAAARATGVCLVLAVVGRSSLGSRDQRRVTIRGEIVATRVLVVVRRRVDARANFALFETLQL